MVGVGIGGTGLVGLGVMGKGGVEKMVWWKRRMEEAVMCLWKRWS
jgi:hypothetical protein